MLTEQEQREALVAASRRWLRTPYHHRARILGVGVDCAQILIASHVEAGLVEDFDVGKYTHDWHLHRGEERYLFFLEQKLKPVDLRDLPIRERSSDFAPLPGDVLMWRVGRTFSHSAIVTQWPFIIHAYIRARMVEEVDIRGTAMARRPVRVYSFWGTR